MMALQAGSWPAKEEGTRDSGTCAESLRDLLIRSCDAAMPRARPCLRRAAYW